MLRLSRHRRRRFWLLGSAVLVLLAVNLLLSVSLGQHQAHQLQRPCDEQQQGKQQQTQQEVTFWHRACPTAGTLPTEHQQQRQPTHHACDGYQGILHIAMGDIGGAAGTIFFQFVVGQLLYAERHHLKPWIHFNNVSYVIYDRTVHGTGPGVTLTTTGERQAINVKRPYGHMKDSVPGEPSIVVHDEIRVRHFPGTGVWEHYFAPYNDFVPGDTSCERLPYVTLTLPQITPGIHAFAPWAPKCWRYTVLPDYITQPHVPLHEWLAPRLQMGASAVQKFRIRLHQDIVAAGQRANPNCSADNPCLGLHIRHSDKSAGRRVIGVDEFLPYAAAFVHEGGQHIYVATDSTAVLKEIETAWPAVIRNKIRTVGNDIVRSSDTTAVFDMDSHHRTNREILIEISALSTCQYLIHGLSAVSDSVLWLNADLQARSVNLELPERMTAASFGTLVQMAQRGVNASHWPGPDGVPILSRNKDWWQKESVPATKKTSNNSCQGYEGILHIQSVSPRAQAAGAFFTDVVNQLLLAKQFNLLPWIHLSPNAERIYDPSAHGTDPQSYGLAADSKVHHGIFKGTLAKTARDVNTQQEFIGKGIWQSYFDPVSDFSLDDASCLGKPVASLDEEEVAGLALLPTSVRAWRYDYIKSEWPSDPSELATMMNETRQRGADVVREHFRLAPYIVKRAREVNPVKPGTTCLALHVRYPAADDGKYRKSVPADAYVEYIQEFLRAGGDHIYLATDSRRLLLHLNNSFPAEVISNIRTQGEHVVRRNRIWTPDMNDHHHRVNSEVLVDIEAMSKCQLLLRSANTVTEAVMYMNPSLNHGDDMTPSEFGTIAREIISRVRSAVPSKLVDHKQSSNVISESVKNATILKLDTGRPCRTNAVVYLAQKTHSSYQRDSYGHLVRSIEQLKKNYLSIDDHSENLDIFIFHTSDFDVNDLRDLERQFDSTSPGIVRLVNLTGSPYWRRPLNLQGENPERWNAYPLFSEGYRRMIHFFAMDIWQFFSEYAQQSGCKYRYILRLDEDSYIHSPIQYDIFDLMRNQDYVYGFRICSYEMHIMRNIWQLFRHNNPSLVPQREIDYQMCGFYNNFFVADIEFFLSPDVQKFLRFVDRRGAMYRRRLGDLLIHSTAVYAFANQSSIHRFLDFTYEHGTVNKTSSCLVWGGIQAGYNDPHSRATMDDYYRRMLVERGCHANAVMLFEDDLSPTYQHTIPPAYRGELSLHTITAGLVELPNKGILSG